jgi:hypothetical protein
MDVKGTNTHYIQMTDGPFPRRDGTTATNTAVDEVASCPACQCIPRPDALPSKNEKIANRWAVAVVGTLATIGYVSYSILPTLPGVGVPTNHGNVTASELEELEGLEEKVWLASIGVFAGMLVLGCVAGFFTYRCCKKLGEGRV